MNTPLPENYLRTDSTQPIRGEAASSELAPIRFPLRTKITLPFLLLTIALAAGAAMLITRVVFDTVDERFTMQLGEAGKLAVESFVNEEKSLLETQRLLAYSDGFASALDQADAETLRKLMLGIMVNQRTEMVELLDADGRLVLSAHHKPDGLLEEYDFSQGGDALLLDWKFVHAALSGVSDQLGDKFAGTVDAGWGRVFYVAGPVYKNEGEIAGAILVGKRLDSLVESLRRKTMAQVSLYDLEGSLISSTLLDTTGLSRAESHTALEQQESSSLVRSLGRRFAFSSSGIGYEEMIGAWQARSGADIGLIGVALPRSFWVHTSYVTRVNIFLLLLTANVLVIFVGVYLTGTITKPLHRLVQAARRVSQGDLQVQVEAASNDEISLLANSFNQMVANLNSSQNDLLQAYDNTLEGWSKMLELRDRETEGHTRRVVELTEKTARNMGIDGEELVNIRRGAILHDIGKVGIPDTILQKPGALTAEEREIIKKHPLYAYEMLKHIRYLRPALEIPLSHHEWWDGSGYPRGIKGTEIPVSARIFALVDVWDALTTDRVYRSAMFPGDAIALIEQGRGRQFDPELVDLFLKTISQDSQD